jgi:hypothetical protein
MSIVKNMQWKKIQNNTFECSVNRINLWDEPSVKNYIIAIDNEIAYISFNREILHTYKNLYCSSY